MADESEDFFPELAAGLVGMVPIAGSLAQPFVRHLTKKMMEERERNASKVLELACRRSGLSREELAELLDRDPLLVTLVNRVLYAAAMNGQTSVLLLLAGHLSDAFRDPNCIDDVHTLLASISTLGEHHIRVLTNLNTPSPTGDQYAEGNGYTWDIDRLIPSVGLRAEVVRAAIQGLLGGGYAHSTGTLMSKDDGLFSSGEFVSITDLGRDLLAALEAIRQSQDNSNC